MNRSIKLGLWLTLGWGAAMFLYLDWLLPWNDLKSIEKLGSFLQGAFAPLAFGWFIIAVFQQQEELAMNRLELKHSIDEFRAQTKQFELQTAISQDAQRKRDARSRDEGLDGRIQQWAVQFEDFFRLMGDARFEFRIEQGKDKVGQYSFERAHDALSRIVPDTPIAQVCMNLETTAHFGSQNFKDCIFEVVGPKIPFGEFLFAISALHRVGSEILNDANTSSNPEVSVRIRKYGVPQIVEALFSMAHVMQNQAEFVRMWNERCGK